MFLEKKELLDRSLFSCMKEKTIFTPKLLTNSKHIIIDWKDAYHGAKYLHTMEKSFAIPIYRLRKNVL